MGMHIRQLSLTLFLWVSMASGLLTSGSCRQCYWNKKHACTHTMFGNSLLWQAHGIGLDGRHSTFSSYADALQYCTHDTGLVDTQLIAKGNSRSAYQEWFAGILGGAPRTEINVPLMQWKDGHELPSAAIPYTIVQRGQEIFFIENNKLSNVTRRPFDPWVRFEQPSEMGQVDDRYPPFKTVATSAPEGIVVPNGTVGELDGGLLMPQQWQTWNFVTQSGGRKDYTSTKAFRIFGQDGLWPSHDEGPYGTPATPFSTAYKLWCGIPKVCPYGYDHDGVCKGLGECHCVHGKCSRNGDCLCSPGFGGVACAQVIPVGLNISNATSCPDPDIFDLCMGRGVCVVKSGGVGITCKCRPGWFGGSADDLLTLTHDEQVQLYASGYLCDRPSDRQWTDISGLMDGYPWLHQCVLYDGEYQPSNWKLDGDFPTIPVAPPQCADGYGGFHCGKCPDCVAAHTVKCGDRDPQFVAQASVVYPPECLCRPGYAGVRCELQTCPGVHTAHGHVLTSCGQDKGHGHCAMNGPPDPLAFLGDGAPFEPFNASYAGRCVCQLGWAGADGDCSVEVCPHDPRNNGKACGQHGTCDMYGCTSVVVANSFVDECVNQCEEDVGSLGPDQVSVRFPLCKKGNATHCCQNQYCLVDSYQYVKAWTCTGGLCACEPGYGKDIHGLCNERICPLGPAGLQCSGAVVPVTNISVCNRHPEGAICECHLTWSAPGGDKMTLAKRPVPLG